MNIVNKICDMTNPVEGKLCSTESDQQEYPNSNSHDFTTEEVAQDEDNFMKLSVKTEEARARWSWYVSPVA